MKLGRTTEYALRGVAFLAGNYGEGCLPLNRVARTTGVPAQFLRKIFQQLARRRVLVSYRGKGGGVRLTRSPDTITVYEILCALEHPITLVSCLEDPGQCPRSGSCPARHYWHNIQRTMIQQLQATSIIELGKMTECASDSRINASSGESHGPLE